MVNGPGGDRCAEAGVGASIIFIALVLISGAAGSVILDSTMSSRDQATETFDAALGDVSAGLEVRGIVGVADDGRSGISLLEIIIAPLPGSRAMNLSEVCVEVLSPSNYDIWTIGEDDIPYERLVGDEGPNSSSIDRGDLVLLHVSLSQPVHGGEAITISLIPSAGLTSTCTARVPEAVSSKYILLR